MRAVRARARARVLQAGKQRVTRGGDRKANDAV